MTRTLLTILISITLMSLSGFSYQNREVKGEIVGWDSTRCGDCGGWMIDINNCLYLTDSIPKGIIEKRSNGFDILPQKVYLRYEIVKRGMRNRIKITSIRKRK